MPDCTQVLPNHPQVGSSLLQLQPLGKSWQCQGSHWKTRTTVPSIYQFHKESATSFGHLHAPANLAPLPNMTSPYGVKNASSSSLTAKFKKPHPCVKHDITKFCIIYEQLYITPAWPPGLLSNLNFHLTQLGHLILQCLWLSYIVLQKVNLEMETQGFNCTVWDQDKPMEA